MKWPLAILAGALMCVIAAAGVATAVLVEVSTLSKWTLASPAIKEPLYVKDLLFENGLGLVLGYRMPDELGLSRAELLARREAVILRLAPGEPQWRTVYSGQGAMFRISSAGQGVLYALGQKFLSDGSQVQFMEKTEDAGATWRQLPPPPHGVVGFRFAPGGRGWAWTSREVFSTERDGISWQRVIRLREDRMLLDEVEPAVDEQGAVWVPDGVRVLRVTASDTSEFPLPKGTELYWIAPAHDGSVWVVARDREGPVLIYRLTAGAKPELLSEQPGFLPYRLHVGREVALLAGCDVGEGDESPTWFMLSSRDGGRRWTREKPQKTSTLSPLYFETDEIVWAYANFGKIQRRSP